MHASMQLLRLCALAILAFSIHAFAQNESLTFDLSSYRASNVVTAEIKTTYNDSLAAPPEPFESNIRRGLRYIRSHGGGRSFKLQAILVRPAPGRNTGRTLADFPSITLLLSNLQRTSIMYSSIEGTAWSQPRIRVPTLEEQQALTWDFNDLVRKMSDAFSALEYTRHTEPWNMIIIGYPDRDPINPSVQASQPYYFFFDATNPGRIVLVGGETPIVAVMSGALVAVEAAVNLTNKVFEVTR